jgi:hypothetical protein
MKIYFLSYNKLTKDYYLDYGCFDRDRKILGKIEANKLVSKLKEILPMQRKIVIYTQEDIDGPIKGILKDSFKHTRVNIQFRKDLESLC